MVIVSVYLCAAYDNILSFFLFLLLIMFISITVAVLHCPEAVRLRQEHTKFNIFVHCSRNRQIPFERTLSIANYFEWNFKIPIAGTGTGRHFDLVVLLLCVCTCHHNLRLARHSGNKSPVQYVHRFSLIFVLGCSSRVTVPSPTAYRKSTSLPLLLIVYCVDVYCSHVFALFTS